MKMLDFLQKCIDYYFAFIPRKQPVQSTFENARLIAHRGAHDRNKHIVENTDAAFTQALLYKCWGIEFDIHETADHRLVVNHDPTLKRLWGQDVAIAELTFQELRRQVPQIPSLEEVVKRYGKRMHLFIELKAPFAAEAQLAKVLQPLTPCENYHLLSLDEAIFASLSQFPKQSLLLVAEHNNVKQFCELSLKNEYGGVLGHYLLMTKNILKQLQEGENQAVGVGMVDSKFSLYRELNRGVPWLFSNDVAKLSRCLKALKEPRK
ncbi:glycerophosphodiester phosphodiesterase [Legionella hackeliae]|uniref:Glycerophosphoryl diester phosphodiesterase family protein n=1 Tax=Legionella hackeliae TaxID=449 RepID=A0A0A8UZL1_LEGHA|nr:glycerophosphodiester phosphodiesterase family protein [Legionella hackeliae]KTD12770.1 glycerophosphoryl diester phosphodiesterase [Legionella hackeliae]CEK12194.1 Glycerophosphoryl diester phosphodiesterase family protein [Legionella hackeliae]STX48979.1 glycerophosphoryl diester phosphodiesterase [Legionella hackeliae]